jgi:hypothetical protein
MHALNSYWRVTTKGMKAECFAFAEKRKIRKNKDRCQRTMTTQKRRRSREAPPSRGVGTVRYITYFYLSFFS